MQHPTMPFEVGEPLSRPTLYHIPVCPFSQRLEILLELKGLRHTVDFKVVDITRPRPAYILALTGGATALPVMRTSRGALRESLVLLDYLDATRGRPIARQDPYQRAVETMLLGLVDALTAAGYRLVMNQDASRRGELTETLLEAYRAIEAFLAAHSPDGTFLFDRFGLAECAYTPIFQRFWFLDYYEGFALRQEEFPRVSRWRDACLAHPAAQQVGYEEIVKVYYDYARGYGNGALPPGRTVSSFAFDPPWQERPMPPRDKYRDGADDAELGLCRPRAEAVPVRVSPAGRRASR